MAKPLELIFAKHDRLDEIAFAEQRKLPGEVGKNHGIGPKPDVSRRSAISKISAIEL